MIRGCMQQPRVCGMRGKSDWHQVARTVVNSSGQKQSSLQAWPQLS